MKPSLEIDRVIFIDVQRGVPDRGWCSDGVQVVLEEYGIPHVKVHVSSASELKRVASANNRAIFWPLDYTFGRRHSGTNLVDVINASGRPYVGCDPGSATNTSKLAFKNSLIAAGIPTPSFHLVDTGILNFAAIRPPAYAKTEFSCDSVGVVRAENHFQLHLAIDELRRSFDQTIFVEEGIVGNEWTIGCVARTEGPLLAALQFEPLHALYVDNYAKNHNDAIRFTLPSSSMQEALQRYAARIITALKLTGYFRLDVVGGIDQGLYAIDMNALPHLNSESSQLSYLPMAFMRVYGSTYSEVVGAVLGAAIDSFGLSSSPESGLANLISQSRLFSQGPVSLS